MRRHLVLILVTAGLMASAVQVRAQKADDDPVKHLEAFLGKWQTQGTFSNGTKVSSDLDCSWSPQKRYLICEQQVSMASGQSHQLTVYGYDLKSGKYTFATFQDNGSSPATGTLEIKGNLWSYDMTFGGNGKSTQVRTTNEFTGPGTEVFKVNVSNDSGASWTTTLQGAAHKVGG